MKLNSILNYIKVDDFISSAGQIKKNQFKILEKNNFDVVINLALFDSSNAIKNENKIVAKYNMTYIHIPVSWENPEIDKLELFLDILKSLQKQNKKVFIHCAKNFRVSMFMYVYKIKVLKQTKVALIAPKKFKANTVWKKFMSKYDVSSTKR